LIDGALGTDFAPMLMNDALNRGQSDSISFKFVGMMQTLKYAE
jgi:hypothetical protein